MQIKVLFDLQDVYHITKLPQVLHCYQIKIQLKRNV